MTEKVAERCRLEIELALQTGLWPKWSLNSPTVQKFLGKNLVEVPGGEGVVAEFELAIKTEVVKGWADTVMGHVRSLDAWAGGDIMSVRGADVREWLAAIVNEGRSKATRNRALTSVKKFFGWAVERGYVSVSPVQHIKKISEPRADEIVYCTRDERHAILEAADKWKAGVAVWVAFYAGLRRSEIGRLTWADVDLERGRIRVRTGKTGRPRVVPVAAALADRLRAAQGATSDTPLSSLGSGSVLYVVPRGQYETWVGLCRMLKEGLQRELADVVPKERVRWNAWRHTFGSLLAQEGVSLDKISAWMGNGPEVCRRHYAAFVPRDRVDEEIDLL